MNDNHLIKIQIFLVTFFILGCSTIHINQTVKFVNIERFMGDWYVIASVPSYIENDAVNPIESYTFNPDGYIDTQFSFYTNNEKKVMKKYNAKGFIRNKETNAEWGMQFFWPIKFSYLIVDLSIDYSFTVISVPSKKYIWIMSRTMALDDEVYIQIIEKLKNNGYDISKIVRTNQIID